MNLAGVDCCEAHRAGSTAAFVSGSSHTMVKKEPSYPDINSWHLDKRVPIATIATILVQAVAFGWMAAMMDARISALEQYTSEIKEAKLRERMAVIENIARETDKKFSHLDDQMSRVEDKLDRIAERVGAKK